MNAAETLRRAATLMRDDFEQEDVEDLRAAETWLAVADWLEWADTAFFAGIRSPANIEHISTFPAVQRAVTVARAYLGESS